MAAAPRTQLTAVDNEEADAARRPSTDAPAHADGQHPRSDDATPPTGIQESDSERDDVDDDEIDDDDRQRHQPDDAETDEGRFFKLSLEKIKATPAAQLFAVFELRLKELHAEMIHHLETIEESRARIREDAFHIAGQARAEAERLQARILDFNRSLTWLQG